MGMRLCSQLLGRVTNMLGCDMQSVLHKTPAKARKHANSQPVHQDNTQGTSSCGGEQGKLQIFMLCIDFSRHLCPLQRPI